MARYLFGGSLPDWAFTTATADGQDNLAQLVGGSTITFFNAETGGTQYTDLTDTTGGAITDVTTSDGTDGRALGTIPPFYGPDGVWSMWASADGGSRALMVSADVGVVLGPQVDTLAASLAAHTSTSNPHLLELSQLTDVDVSTLADGYSVVWDETSGKYVLSNVAGLSAAAAVLTAGGSTIRIPDGDSTTQALLIRVPSGDRTTLSAPDTLSVEWNAGTDGSPNWRRTGWFNEFGELRTQASAPTRVPFRVKQRDGTQTANLIEATDNSNNALAWVTATGGVRGANVNYSPVIFAKAGTLTTGTGAGRIYNDSGHTWTIRSVRASVGTAPVGSDIEVDVNLNGSTIFSGTKPTIADGANTSGKLTSMTTTSWADGQYMTVDIDAIGSGTAGSDLVVQIAVY